MSASNGFFSEAKLTTCRCQSPITSFAIFRGSFVEPQSQLVLSGKFFKALSSSTTFVLKKYDHQKVSFRTALLKGEEKVNEPTLHLNDLNVNI